MAPSPLQKFFFDIIKLEDYFHRFIKINFIYWSKILSSSNINNTTYTSCIISQFSNFFIPRQLVANQKSLKQVDTPHYHLFNNYQCKYVCKNTVFTLVTYILNELSNCKQYLTLMFSIFLSLESISNNWQYYHLCIKIFPMVTLYICTVKHVYNNTEGISISEGTLSLWTDSGSIQWFTM